MKKIILISAVLFGVCILKVNSADSKAESVTYHTYASEESSEEAIAKTFVQFKDLPDKQTSINREKHDQDSVMKDEFVLDRNYSLESWQRTNVKDDTDLSSVKEGKILVVKGKLKGKMIDKQIKLDNKPLYIYPKYSLAKFAMSEMPKIKFWTLRRDKMKKLPMKAVNKGVKTIDVDGKQVEAIMVYYSIADKLREKHYNQNYYYRKSDGLYVKKEEPKGGIEVLVKEE